MNKIRNALWHAAGIVVVGVLSACSPGDAGTAIAPDQAVTSTAPQPVIEAPPAPAPVVCASCGIVRSITAVQQQGQTSGVGAALGAIVGGVAGNQVGGGSGQKIATVAGAVGGALLGNNIEQNRNTTTNYEVAIDMESGGQTFITVPDASGIVVGSAVLVEGSTISLR